MDALKTYKKAIKLLFHLTNGKFEHDENKAIELFAKLIDRGITIDCDTVKNICQEVGYLEPAAQEISMIYDIINHYKQYKTGKDISHWTNEMIDEVCCE